MGRWLWLVLWSGALTPAVARPWPSSRAVHSVATGDGAWLAGGEGRVFASTDAGRSWQVVLHVHPRGAHVSDRWRAKTRPIAAPRGLRTRALRLFRHVGRRRAIDDDDEEDPEPFPPFGAQARSARFTATAVAPGLACAGSARGLWCARRGGRWRRVRLPRADGVLALLADADGASRLFVGLGGGLFAIDARLRVVPLMRGRAVRRLAAVGRRVYAAGEKGLWRLDAGVPRRVALLPGRPQALAGSRGDLYLAARGRLWRLESDRWLALPSVPSGAIRAIAVCGRTLWLAGTRGLWRLGPMGWQERAAGAVVREMACVGSELLLATASGPSLAGRAPKATAALRGWLARLDARLARDGWLAPSRAFSRRARWAAWLPRLTVLVRAASLRDARHPASVLARPWVDRAWRYDPVLRIRGSERVEVVVVARWPLGDVRPQRRWVETLRVERRLAWLRARRWTRIAHLLRALSAFPSGQGGLPADVQHRLWRDELRALHEGLAPVERAPARGRS